MSWTLSQSRTGLHRAAQRGRGTTASPLTARAVRCSLSARDFPGEWMSVEAAGCRPIPAVEARRIVMATAAASWCAGVIPVLGLMMLAPPPARALAPGAQEAASIAVDAYIYFYPLVLMDFTCRQMTNVEPGKAPGRGPMNTFVHMRSYPSVDFKDVVRPNFDTLYSIAWLDLSEGPVVVSVPDLGDRYYLLPFLDMWSEVFACPGKR